MPKINGWFFGVAVGTETSRLDEVVKNSIILLKYFSSDTRKTLDGMLVIINLY